MSDSRSTNLGCGARTTRTITETGLTLTRLGVGGGPFGNLLAPLAAADVATVVGSALDLGLRYFDTAPIYGFGLAEERLGRALSGVDRDRFVLATKVGRLLRSDAPPDPALFHDGEPFFRDTPPVNPVRDFSHRGVHASLEESLGRLGLERADIVYIHEPEREHIKQVIEQAYPALAEMRAEQRVKAIGLGSDLVDVMVELVEKLDLDCLLLASRYTLLDHSALDELLPLCVRRGVAVIVGGVFNSGILADPVNTPLYEYVPASEEVRDRVAEINEVCRRWKIPLRAAALQFPLAHPAVACAVVGMRNIHELEQNVAMLDVEIPADLWAELAERQLIAAGAPAPGGGEER